jgi:hypothetical protein
MSQFPVQDEAGLYEGVNYLLSGPSGLGQNFSGFSDYNDYWITGNFRLPFSQDTEASLYVAPIALSNAEQLDSRTIRYTFAAAQAQPPFSLGNGLTVTGITPSSYNSSSLKAADASINQIGVVECTTTSVTVRTIGPVAVLAPYVSGGAISYAIAANYIDSAYNSTDCNARVTVTGATDRVFISAQINQLITYDVLSGPSDFRVWVVINRYKGFTNEDPINPDYRFERDATVTRKIYTYPGLSSTGTLPELETVFTTVVDQPVPGYYWYILEVVYEYPNVGGVEVQVLTAETNLRSLSAQVVKA